MEAALICCPVCDNPELAVTSTGQNRFAGSCPECHVGVTIDTSNCTQPLEPIVRVHPRPDGRHALAGLLLDARYLIKTLPIYLNALPVLVSVPDTTLDFSLPSIVPLDRALATFDTEYILNPDLFPCLVGYVGEVIRREVGGKWVLSQDSESKIWEPWIEDATGRRYNPWLELIKAVYEGYTSSITANAIASELGRAP